MDREKYTKKPFTLLKKYWKKHGSNAYKFEDEVLLCSHTFVNGNQDHLFSEDEDINGWGEVSIYAFNTDKEYQKLYELAENPSNRNYLFKENK
jgi:hypothetical protein